MIEFATVARPYAKALFELASEKQQLANWLRHLGRLAWVVEQSEVKAFIAQPEISSTQKAEQLIQILNEDQAIQSAEFENFVRVVSEEKRLAILPEIFVQYQDLVLSQDNVQQAVVYTAFEIADEQQKAQIISDLEQHFNTRLQATFEIQPELIGGIKVEVGDQVLDLSVQGKLQKLYTTMTN